jgi:hypothetical protein
MSNDFYALKISLQVNGLMPVSAEYFLAIGAIIAKKTHL